MPTSNKKRLDDVERILKTEDWNQTKAQNIRQQLEAIRAYLAPAPGTSPAKKTNPLITRTNLSFAHYYIKQKQYQNAISECKSFFEIIGPNLSHRDQKTFQGQIAVAKSLHKQATEALEKDPSPSSSSAPPQPEKPPAPPEQPLAPPAQTTSSWTKRRGTSSKATPPPAQEENPNSWFYMMEKEREEKEKKERKEEEKQKKEKDEKKKKGEEEQQKTKAEREAYLTDNDFPALSIR